MCSCNKYIVLWTIIPPCTIIFSFSTIAILVIGNIYDLNLYLTLGLCVLFFTITIILLFIIFYISAESFRGRINSNIKKENKLIDEYRIIIQIDTSN